MKVTTVQVLYSRTFNLGSYNSAKFECGLAAEIEEGEDGAAVAALLYDVAKATVRAQAMPVLQKRQAEVDAIKSSVPGMEANDD